MTQDPPRLSDDPTAPGLARALRDAQGDGLSPEAVARVRAGLATAGVVAGAAAAGLGAAARAPWAKLLGGAVRIGLAGLGIAGVVGVVSVLRAPDRAEAPAATAIHAAAPPDDPGPAPSPEETSAAPAPDAPAAPSPSTAARTRASAGARTPAAGAAPSPREGALLLEARRALEVDAARALSLVRAHEAEFPQSQLGPERARIAAEARRRLEK